MIKNVLSAILLSATLCTSVFADSTENIHKTWDMLVKQHVKPINNGHSTEVDYHAMKNQRNELKRYLDLLGSVTQSEFDHWDKSKQLAFLINAYNAWTVEFILTKYPDIESIKDLGSFFSSPWSQEFIPLLGKIRSLDDVEHGLIRGSVDSEGNAKYNDPRIHFAVNCASIGCPALREEAYSGEKLAAQLEQQTIRFLSDKTRNVVKGNTLNVSSIFKWYRGDFEKGFKSADALNEFLLLYANTLKLSPSQQEALSHDNMKINFLNYDWKLNVQH